MPFNGSGTFTIVNTFTPNTTISSSAVNGNFSDIAAGLSDCLTRDGQAGMSAPLDIVSGTVGNPGLEFTSQQGTGLYLATAGNVGLAIASAQAFAFSAPSTANGAGILGSLGAVILPVGTVWDFAGTAAPTGWLLCYGQEVSQTAYTQLYATIGTAFGTASTSTAFCIPDLRGRVVAGKDDMGGAGADRITSADSGIDGVTRGAAGGDQLMQGHDHSVTDAGHTHDIHFRTASFATGSNNAIISISTVETTTAAQAAISNTTGIVIDTSGAGSSGNVQPTMVMNKIIFAGHG